MEYVKRLPIILSMFMSTVICIVSIIQEIDQKKIYTRLIISIVLFYALGMFVKSRIEKIYISIKEKDEKSIEEKNGESEKELVENMQQKNEESVK